MARKMSAKATQEAAFATGFVPITLIDGDKLIESGFGVRKRTIDLLEVEPSDFLDEEVTQ